MKKLIYTTATLIVALILIVPCKKEFDLPGTLHGVITDKATGEPVSAAGVQLNTGVKTITGSEGQYEFTELKAGEYTLQVSKTGYTELLGHKVQITAGQTMKSDVQIEKLPAALHIVDGNAQKIEEIDFGSEESVTNRSFNIFNDSPNSLEWRITNNCNWISELNETAGNLAAGKQITIIVTINRDNLTGGENKYILNISSDNGSKELKIIATGKSVARLNTLEISNITSTTATFNGELIDKGSPIYTERGFVYSLSPMPTIDNTISKLTVPITENNIYTSNVASLTLGNTYYVRAYAINSEGIAYSANEQVFTAARALPQITTNEVSNINIENLRATLNGTIKHIGDPSYTERGFVYGLFRNPSIEDGGKQTVLGSGLGAFSLNITDLTENQTYYVRAYAINEIGTAYGDEITFNTNKPNTITLEAENLMVQTSDIGQYSWDTGCQACEESAIDNYTDWRMPSKDELMILYLNKEEIGGFQRSGYYSEYWSRTTDAHNSSYYYTQSFSNGSHDVVYELNTRSVRCIRNLTP